MPDNSMTPAANRNVLNQRLAEIGTRWPATQPAMVAEVVRSVLASMRGDLTRVETSLLSEVAELGRTIAAARAEISALGVDDITASQIPSATDELDAIGAHTAAATDTILGVCETLDAVGATLDSTGAQRTVTILGIDEADSSQAQVSWVSPIARTLLKARTGDVLQLVTPIGVVEIEVISVQYPVPG